MRVGLLDYKIFNVDASATDEVLFRRIEGLALKILDTFLFHEFGLKAYEVIDHDATATYQVEFFRIEGLAL